MTAPELKFASQEEAIQLLSSEDAFTRVLSPFDIDARVGEASSTLAQLMEIYRSEARAWSDEEKTLIRESVSRVYDSMTAKGMAWPLSSALTFVKTTTKEEGGAAGYTRGEYIVLGPAVSSMSSTSLDGLVAHELFHVISRQRPDLRERLYAEIGFSLMDEVSYPEGLSRYRITNPDATQTDNYIRLDVAEQSVPCMMILYAKGDYAGGSFFQYLQTGFLQLSDEDLTPVMTDEGPLIHSLQEVGGFFEQVGKNTQYIIHPEEILADNFSMLILGKAGLPDADLLEKIKRIFLF